MPILYTFFPNRPKLSKAEAFSAVLAQLDITPKDAARYQQEVTALLAKYVVTPRLWWIGKTPWMLMSVVLYDQALAIVDDEGCTFTEAYDAATDILLVAINALCGWAPECYSEVASFIATAGVWCYEDHQGRPLQTTTLTIGKLLEDMTRVFQRA